MDEQKQICGRGHKVYKTGIYTIRCMPNGKTYVGAAIDIVKRFTWHRHYLRRNIHPNTYLQTDFNTYGEASFEFVRHFLCAKDELTFYEDKFINELSSSIDANGYNILTAGGLGRKNHPSTKERVRSALKAIGYRPTKENHEKSLEVLRKKVVNNETGRVYQSVAAASIDLQVNESTLRNWLKGRSIKRIDVAFV